MSTMAGLRTHAKIQTRRTKCAYCGCRAGKAVKTRLCNGTYRVWLRCNGCGENVQGKGHYLRHNAVHIERLPLHEDHTENASGCERCGSKEGVELHHWAPRELFGDDRDFWPTGWLCPKHHEEWHAIMGSNGGSHRRKADG